MSGGRSQKFRRRTDMETELRKRLEIEFTSAEITVDMDGNRAAIRIIADVFEGLAPVKRQQKVYRCMRLQLKRSPRTVFSQSFSREFSG